MKTRIVKIGGVAVGGGRPLALIAGPCVIESRRACLDIAGKLARLARENGIPFVFKASYDKANRSSIASYRGTGLSRGLDILREVKERFGVPVMTDVHGVDEVERAAGVADLLQCPAFLSRQTDLLVALGRSGLPVNVKKGQFLAPDDMKNVVAKIESTGNRRILLTERGVSFGYHNLVADMRSLQLMRELGYPVIFDASHSVQLPGGAGSRSGGASRLIPCLARAGVAAGCDAVFIETHPNPAKALSDSESMLPLVCIKKLWKTLAEIDVIVRKDKDAK